MDEPRFKIGDTVWTSDWGMKKVWVVCPVCDGNLEIKVTLGNGTEVMIDCRYCQAGIEPPKGKVISGYERSPTAERKVITGLSLDTKRAGKVPLRVKRDHMVVVKKVVQV